MPPRSTNAPKLTTDDTVPSRISPGLRLVRKLSRDSFCVSSRYARRLSTTLLRFLSSSMILACTRLPTYGCRSRTRRSSTSDAGRKPRRPMSTMRPPLTTSITGPSTMPSSSLIFSIVPHARSYCARFLDSSRRPSLSSFWRTSASTFSPSDDDLVRVDVVADAQLARRDDALALVADVEQHLVLVDLDDRAVDELAVLDVDHRAVDGIGEGHAEIVDGDLARGVVALLVEGAHGVAAADEEGSGCRTRDRLLSKVDRGIDGPGNGRVGPRPRNRDTESTGRSPAALASSRRRLRARDRGGRSPGTPVTRWSAASSP